MIEYFSKSSNYDSGESDVIFRVINRGDTLSVILKGDALAAIKEKSSYIVLGVDTDEKRIYLVPETESQGYKVTSKGTRKSSYTTIKSKKLIKKFKGLAGGEDAGKTLKRDSKGNFFVDFKDDDMSFLD